MKTKLIILQFLAGVFGLVWIAAAIAAVYFLYGALANDAPWSGLIWSVAVGFVSKQIAAALNGNKQRLEYVDLLTQRGYVQADAEAAWRTASGGGVNLLRNLQQAEIGDEIARLESAISTGCSETTGD
jgi:hypothetical protein